MALPTVGTSRLSVMPDASLLKQIHKMGPEEQRLLKQIHKMGPEEQQENIRLEDCFTVQTACGQKELYTCSRGYSKSLSKFQKSHCFLAAPWLLTITSN